jgi:GNAT superfamily N-acetyltransferase
MEQIPEFPIINSEITYLEMASRPILSRSDFGEYKLTLISKPNLSEYLAIYKAVGRDYNWNYRPGQTFQEINEILNSPLNMIYYFYHQDAPIGLAEIDWTDSLAPEIVHFGLTPEYLNKGIGKNFLNNLLLELWEKQIDRVWLSTCEMDHPKAINFYQQAGFKIVKTKIGEFRDYRNSKFYREA